MSAKTDRRLLSQDEIDAMFQRGLTAGAGDMESRAARYDFLRPDRISASQLRAIRLLHENFARSMASSLSAYLRSFIMVDLVSFEQLSYAEFVGGLPTPTVVVGLGLRPYEGSGILEMGPGLFYPILEILLGGSKPRTKPLTREITDIEQRLLEMLLRVVVQDLRDAWKTVVPIDFAIQGIEKEPQFLQILAPSEAVIAIGMDVHLGECSGLLNIAIPSLVIKMMRHKFDHHWLSRRADSTTEDQDRMLHLLGPTDVDVQVNLKGATAAIGDLLRIQEGDLLLLDVPSDRPLQCDLNGRERFRGHLAQAGRKCAFVVDDGMEER